MAENLIKDVLSNMAKMLDNLENGLNDIYTFGISLEERFGIELRSSVNDDLVSLGKWRNFWQSNILKLQAMHKEWSMDFSKVSNIAEFNILFGTVDEAISLKIIECRLANEYCMNTAAAAVDDVAVAEDAAVVVATTDAAASAIVESTSENIMLCPVVSNETCDIVNEDSDLSYNDQCIENIIMCASV